MRSLTRLAVVTGSAVLVLGAATGTAAADDSDSVRITSDGSDSVRITSDESDSVRITAE